MCYIWDIETGYATKSGKYKTDLEQLFIFNNINGTNNYILDIGGGSGRFAVPLANAGNSLTVIEPNEEALTILKKRNKTIRCIARNLESYETGERYDVILAMEVIGYFKNPEYLFKKVSNSLNDSGIIIFTFVNQQSIKSFIKKAFFNNSGTYYPGYTSLKNYLKIFEDNSLRVLDIKGIGWLPFKINSNSFLIPYCIKFINVLRLNKWISGSPEIIVCVGK